MTFAIVPNTRTNWYDPQIAAGAPVVIQNINYLTGDPNSVMNSTIRLIQDVFKRWTATSVREGLALGGQGTGDVTVSAGYANIQARHIYNDASVNISATLADDDYYVVITSTEVAESQTRDPSNDTIAPSAELVSGYSAASNKLVLGKFTVVTNVATVVTSYSQVGEVRTGHIMPPQLPDGSSLTEINIWTGETEKRKMAIFTGDHLNIINDSGRVQLGASQQLYSYHSGVDAFFTNTVGDFEFNTPTDFRFDFGGTFFLRDSDNADQNIMTVSPTAFTLLSTATALITTPQVTLDMTGTGLIIANQLAGADPALTSSHASIQLLSLTGSFLASADIDGATIGGITSGNLLDKAAIETITGAWIIDSATGLTFNNQGAGGDPILLSNAATQILNLTGSLLASANIDGVTIGGITSANLLDKTATETITNTWTFNSAGGIVVDNQLAGANPTLTSSHATLQQLLLTGELNVSSIVAGTADYDKFLVSDGGRVKFRTGAQAFADMGGQTQDDFLDDLAGLTQTANSIPYMDTATTADIIDFSEGANKLQLGDVLIQWGFENGGFSSGEKTITFGTAYTTAPVVTCSHEANNVSSIYFHGVSINNPTTTGFVMQARIISNGGTVGDAAGDVTWIAIGINTA